MEQDQTKPSRYPYLSSLKGIEMLDPFFDGIEIELYELPYVWE